MVVPDEKGAKGNYALKGSFAPQLGRSGRCRVISKADIHQSK
jgi:hypothetical protein